MLNVYAMANSPNYFVILSSQDNSICAC